MHLGDFHFDPTLNELSRDGQATRLPKRLGDLLSRLAQDPGQLVRRETLLDEVWERKFVNEEVLSRAIADLRLALGDDARQPRYIETLPKLGYRLICPVRPARAPEPAPAPQPSPPPPRAPRGTHRILLAALALAAVLAAVLLRDPAAPPPAHLTPERLLHARPFTSEPGRELHPRFTPDGRFVVYTRYVPGDGPAHLRLRAVDGTEDRALVQDEHDNVCGLVTPDGTRLAWLRTRGDRCDVMLRDLLGGVPRLIGECRVAAGLGCPDFFPDGLAIALEGAPGGGLARLALADGTATQLTQPSSGQQDVMPRVARDGTLVFWRAEGAARRLMRTTPGGDAQAIEASTYLAFGHAFDVDGRLVTADDRFGQRALVRHDETGATLLGGPGARFPDIGADGALVHESAHYDANLWGIDLADPDAPPRRLTTNARYDSQPALSPDGAWLAFGSNRDGREAIYLMRRDGRDERKLPLDPAQRWTSPSWTADGAALVVLRYTGRDASACRHDLATARTECPPGLASHRNGTFDFGDGRFGAVDEAATDARLWRHAFDGAPAERVETAGPVDRCRATTRWLACHRPGQAGLWVQDRATGQARTAAPELGAGARAWDLTDEAAWFARGGDLAGLWRHDLDSGETRRVHALVPSAIGDALSVSRDGRFAVVARTDALEVDLMLLPAQEREEKRRPGSGR